MVYDNGDSSALPPSEYVVPDNGAYYSSPPTYAEPEVVYAEPEPYYGGYYGGEYYGGCASYCLFFDMPARDHREHDQASYDRYHHHHSEFHHSRRAYSAYRDSWRRADWGGWTA